MQDGGNGVGGNGGNGGVTDNLVHLPSVTTIYVDTTAICIVLLEKFDHDWIVLSYLLFAPPSCIPCKY
jgi:hypothetical protein